MKIINSNHFLKNQNIKKITEKIQIILLFIVCIIIPNLNNVITVNKIEVFTVLKYM